MSSYINSSIHEFFLLTVRAEETPWVISVFAFLVRRGGRFREGSVGQNGDVANKKRLGS